MHQGFRAVAVGLAVVGGVFTGSTASAEAKSYKATISEDITFVQGYPLDTCVPGKQYDFVSKQTAERSGSARFSIGAGSFVSRGFAASTTGSPYADDTYTEVSRTPFPDNGCPGELKSGRNPNVAPLIEIKKLDMRFASIDGRLNLLQRRPTALCGDSTCGKGFLLPQDGSTLEGFEDAEGLETGISLNRIDRLAKGKTLKVRKTFRLSGKPFAPASSRSYTDVFTITIKRTA